MGRFLIHIDAQDAQDFFRRRLACVPGHPQIRTRSSPESASPAAASRPDYPVLCIDVQFIVLLDGSAQSRGAGARLAGKREFPKGDRPAFREVARRIPPTSPSGRHPRERGRPARMLSLRLPLSFPAMLQPTALPARTAWASRGRAPLPVEVEKMASCGRMGRFLIPLSFPAMLQPTALPARTAWARPKQRQGAAAG